MRQSNDTSISVIIPCYNAETFIVECIKSVLDQTYPVKEIFVVDDGSTDETASIANSFGGIVRVFKQRNRGVSSARNLAVKNGTGELIAFLDADDLWAPEKLERQVAYLSENKDVAAVVSSFSIFGPGKRTIDSHLKNEILLNHEAIDFLASPILFPSILLVRADVAKYVSFQEDVDDGEDLIYASEIRTYGPIGSVNEVLAFRRQHSAQVTKSALHFGRSFDARLAWAKKNYSFLGIDSAEFAEATMFDGAVRNVLASYWTRDFKRFKAMRKSLLARWPEATPVPKELKCFVPPLFLVKVKDFCDTLLSKRKPQQC